MTKDEIKKGLECCCGDDDHVYCNSCPYVNQACCRDYMGKDAHNLINEQEKENDLLKMQLQDAVNHATTFLEEANKFEAENKRLKVEIEQLKADNKVWATQVYQAYDNGYKDGYESTEEDIIQAKIDVLNELKEKYGFYSCYSWNCEVKSLNEIVDDMIEELQK